MGLLSAIYNTALSGRRLVYNSRLKKVKKLPAKVISIGNLTLGGTGKTPAVIAVAGEARRRGIKPCILTRGYKGTLKGPALVSSFMTDPSKTSLLGDEPVLMGSKLGDIPIVKGRNRYAGGIYALDKIGRDSIDMFILDDGFQHWGLYRDMDILLVDATNPFGNKKLFPEGMLREPLQSIRRADIIVITRADAVNRESLSVTLRCIKQYHHNVAVYTASYKPKVLVSLSGETRDIDTLKNKKVYLVAGIVNPSYFKYLLHSLGADIVKFKRFRDHYVYTQQDVERIGKEAEGTEIITTEKDLVKLKELKLPFNVSALGIVFDVEDDFYDILFKRISDDTD